jgi:hypothetical protein
LSGLALLVQPTIANAIVRGIISVSKRLRFIGVWLVFTAVDGNRLQYSK